MKKVFTIACAGCGDLEGEYFEEEVFAQAEDHLKECLCPIWVTDGTCQWEFNEGLGSWTESVLSDW